MMLMTFSLGLLSFGWPILFSQPPSEPNAFINSDGILVVGSKAGEGTMAIELIVHPGVDNAFIAWRATCTANCCRRASRLPIDHTDDHRRKHVESVGHDGSAAGTKIATALLARTSGLRDHAPRFHVRLSRASAGDNTKRPLLGTL